MYVYVSMSNQTFVNFRQTYVKVRKKFYSFFVNLYSLRGVVGKGTLTLYAMHVHSAIVFTFYLQDMNQHVAA